MDKRTITRGLKYLAQADVDIARELAIHGKPEPRYRPPGFEAFVAAVVSQQISKEAAATIFKRLQALVPDFDASAFVRTPSEQLREAGLSRRKIEYLQALAEAVDSGHFKIDSLTNLADCEVIDAITALRGFGRWSAEIYLMFSLGRKDIFPADDLALQIALSRLKGLDEKPKPKLARQLTEHWAPWRSVGSLFLWHYYRGAPQ